ncbi:MAG: hypothetical protein QOD75_3126 [Blastocatellia bacterium]|nr:hypothetical protein [Blastocatellia bacterium]
MAVKEAQPIYNKAINGRAEPFRTSGGEAGSCSLREERDYQISVVNYLTL